MMASTPITCELISNNVHEPTSIQFDEEHHVLYVLTGAQLTRLDFNEKTANPEIVYQHKREFNDEDEYSQGESDNDDERVCDPFEDSEPSTDDDEEKIHNRRNWRRRYGWRIYQLDNPCSILFLSETKQLIILNEGVMTFVKIQLEKTRPFIQGSSINIFCYDFNLFNENGKQLNIQPWSITQTSMKNSFLFSLLNNNQLYSLDMTNEKIRIEKFTTTNIYDCPYLLYHCQSNHIFVYHSTDIFVLSLSDRTTIKIETPFIEQGKDISTITIDKEGLIYILSHLTIFKCQYQFLQFHLIESFGPINPQITYPQMIVTNHGKTFYLSDMENNSIYRWTKD